MKKISFIALSALPVLGLVSCGEKEAPAAPANTEAAAPTETPAPAATKTAPATAEDYMLAIIETMEELVATVEATNAGNSAEQAKKVSELATKMNTLLAEAAAKGFTDAEPTPEMNARMEAAGTRLGAWIIANAESLESFDPSFMEALGSVGM